MRFSPRNLFQEAQRVVGVVDAEGRADDGQHHGDLCAGGHARHRVRAFDRPDLSGELDVLPALAGAVDVDRAAVERRVKLIGGQRRFARSCDWRSGHGHAEIVKELEGDRAAERDAVFDIAGERVSPPTETMPKVGMGTVMLPSVGLVGSRGTGDAIRVGEDELRALRNEGVGRAGADIEAAKLLPRHPDRSAGRAGQPCRRCPECTAPGSG